MQQKGKHVFWANLMIWVGAAVSFVALANCLTGGALWLTLGLLPVAIGLTFGGIMLTAKGAAANASSGPPST